MKKKAFTIVELVIVIAVIGTLMAVGFVGGSKMTERSREVAIDSQFSNIESAIISVLRENPRLGLITSLADEHTPGVTHREHIVDLINEYLDSESQFEIDANGVIVSTFEDPYGVPYQLGISVNKLIAVTEGKTSAEIRFFVKSAGGNKQTPASATNATDVIVTKADLDDVILMVESVHNTITSTRIEDIVIDPAATPPASSNDGDVVFPTYASESKNVTLNGASSGHS